MRPSAAMSHALSCLAAVVLFVAAGLVSYHLDLKAPAGELTGTAVVVVESDPLESLAVVAPLEIDRSAREVVSL